VEARLLIWEALLDLLRHADDLTAADTIRAEVQAIHDQRLLLDNPDPVRPLGRQLEDLLRRTLLTQQEAVNQMLHTGWDQLENDPSWKTISAVQQRNLAENNQIDQSMELQIGDFDSLRHTLETMPLRGWQDRIDALSRRFDRTREEAARLLAPQAQTVHVPRQTLNSEAELTMWLDTLAAEIRAALGKGPVILK